MSGTVRGIIWMLVSSLFFVGVTGIVRHLGSDMNAVQAAFIRYALGCALFLPLYLRLVRERRYPARVGTHFARGLVHGIGVMLWFYAMARIPIAEVTASASVPGMSRASSTASASSSPTTSMRASGPTN